MQAIRISIFIVAVAALAGTAHAQGNQGNFEPSIDNPHSSLARDEWRPMGPGLAERTVPRSALFAMRDNDFTKAETIFADFLPGRSGHADGNLYMGIAKLNLGKWAEARTYLEVAATKAPRNPNPKIHLGVAYARLGNAQAAADQRAALVKMSKSHRISREESAYIKEGIARINEALFVAG